MIGGEKFYPLPLSQNSILGKKRGGDHQEWGKNFTNSDLFQTFRVTPGQLKNWIGDEKITPPPPTKNPILGKKGGGGAPQIRHKFNHSDLAQNFRVTSDQQKIVIRGENLPPPLSQNSILGKKGEGGAPQIRQKFNQLGFGSNFQGNLIPVKGCDWRWKILPPHQQNLILGKKGEHPK